MAERAGHQHRWRLLANPLGLWLWICDCGTYRNADGRLATARTDHPAEKP